MKYEYKMIEILSEEVFYKAMAEYYVDYNIYSFIDFCRERREHTLLAAFFWNKSIDGYYYWKDKSNKLIKDK